MTFFKLALVLISGLFLSTQNSSAQLIVSTEVPLKTVKQATPSKPTAEMIKVQEEQLSKEIKALLSKNIVYSEIAVENNFEGTVRVIVLIGQNGEAPKIKILSSLPELFEEELLEQLLLSELIKKIPANYAGKPYFLTDIRFSLR